MRKSLGFLFVATTLGIGGCKKEVPPTPPAAPAIVDVEIQEDPVAAEVELVQNQAFERVYFLYDSSDLDATAKRTLKHNADLLNQYRSVKIRVQGHADERGTTEYNLHLGQRRAQRTLDYLVSQGVSPKRIELISYGEEIPLETPAEEYAFSKNRRAEFEIVRGDVNTLQGSID